MTFACILSDFVSMTIHVDDGLGKCRRDLLIHLLNSIEPACIHNPKMNFRDYAFPYSGDSLGEIDAGKNGCFHGWIVWEDVVHSASPGNPLVDHPQTKSNEASFSHPKRLHQG